MRKPILFATLPATLLIGACGRAPSPAPSRSPLDGGTAVAVIDTVVTDVLDAAGTAQPVSVATLSTKLMGTVTAVTVHEGDRVAAGQLLVQLDARDLDAKRGQVEAALAEAVAGQQDAAAQAVRMRALYADSAATKAQLDQAETGLARTAAAVASARAMVAELAATTSYAQIRAPFPGIVTRRAVDPGAFAAPGTPLVTVEDSRTLRITVSTSPDAVRGLVRGGAITATIGDVAVRATVEGIAPAGPNQYTVNALVPNENGRFLSASAATLALPRGTRRAILVPADAIVRQGDLAGVRAVIAGRAALRWVKLGHQQGGLVEVLAGLSPGDSVRIAGAGL